VCEEQNIIMHVTFQRGLQEQLLGEFVLADRRVYTKWCNMSTVCFADIPDLKHTELDSQQPRVLQLLCFGNGVEFA